ncbi:oxygen-independent coproporphyrinogen III oxidase [Yunchengibacter salinarum]|uniref:oxygen-independent coproporphyrinogen III oxidase n=1 Tax=Yunchengibacter salinarum TaxID=3133399 RepID=UPI0035B68DE1
MQARLTPYAAESVPRYTSYPTAPHFHGGVTADTYAAWLSQARPDGPLSLYLHIPFCRQLCWYCGCNTVVANRTDRAAPYVAALETEIARVGQHLARGVAGACPPVAAVHFGGGTPTFLSRDHLLGLMAALKRHFTLLPTAEVALEADPRTLDGDCVDTLRRMGVTRVSLGVQDFDGHVQKAINRVQPYEQVAAAVARLRAVGIDHIAFDLMVGLPGQTVASVEETARLAVGLNPDRLAVFGYAHVPWFKKHQRLIDETALPDGDARFDQRAAVNRLLAECGYEPVGFDHFARAGDAMATAAVTGDLRRNFQGFTTDDSDTLIAFGASAIGSPGAGYVQNAVDIGSYRRVIESGTLATVKGIAVSAEDRLRRRVIERLMCDFKVDVGHECRLAGFRDDHLDGGLADLVPLAADGLCRLDGRTVRVPGPARALVRVVASRFDAYFMAAATGGGARHSSAV